MRDHIVRDVSFADFLVDLSNVIRSHDSRHRAVSGLIRFERLLDALVIRENDPDVRTYLVVDRSLFAPALLPESERRVLSGLRRDGLLEVLDDADERLLELAQATGLQVISSDRFRGHRVEHPWLQGNTHQFLEPHVENDGRMVVRPVDLGVASSWDISRHAEKDQLKKQGLLAGPRRTPRYDILDRRWSCPDSRCTLYDTTRGTHVLLPRVRKGVPTCEVHGLGLADDGPRAPVVQLKLIVDGECVERFTCSGDGETPVGRAPTEGISIDPWLTSTERSLVSRHHFTLILRNGGLWVRDHSTNGTRISTRGRNGVMSEPIKLFPEQEHAVGPSDKIWFTARVTLSRSGRKFPSEIAQDYSHIASNAAASRTSRSPD
ncbi:hypothetical protein GCM10009556_100070 [Acrocarpospora pleiomorpha]|uniref:FHA domain-containing protein n=1 Tax=Acrocarpospora pleiomorpha TaxID=90975 RepID=UPI0031CF9296